MSTASPMPMHHSAATSPVTYSGLAGAAGGRPRAESAPGGAAARLRLGRRRRGLGGGALGGAPFGPAPFAGAAFDGSRFARCPGVLSLTGPCWHRARPRKARPPGVSPL
ncbi:hypothetical protein ACFQY7_33520 [Actinomadura luteofluorescens]|uniref:hypothetical protein n=1 Tax=Actinomadura luteofluorescens TaxID=46163 RepID=UPI00363E80C1